jgi:hypothetical protein
MPSAKALKPANFFGGNRYAAYLDELTASGTIAGQSLSPAERKEGFRKRGDKINFEKFVNKVIEKKTGPAMGGPGRALPGGGGGAIVKSAGSAVQPFVASPVAAQTQENLDEIMQGIDSILETLRAEQKFEKKKAGDERKRRERTTRATREDKLEKSAFTKLGEGLKKAIAPVKSIFDKIFEFLFTVLVGRVLVKFVEWFSDSENERKIKAIGRFLKDKWPLLLTSFLLFGTTLGRFITKLVFTAGKWIAKLTGFIIPKLFSFIKKNPRTAALLAGGTALGFKLLTDKGESGPEEPEQFSSGGRVPGTGTADTVSAMLTPGEYVMSRGAVSKYGVDFMEGLNASGGGGRTFKPGFYSSGGLVSDKDEPGGRYTGGRSMAQRIFDPLQIFSQDRPRISASAGQQNGSGTGGTLKLSAQDFRDLAYIVSAEAARGTDDEYGVAAAVLNRMTDPKWPNTIAAVGSQAGQFEAVYKGLAYDDPELAAKLASPEGQAKIVEALKKLNGRTDFKGQSQLANKGSTDPMFHSRGNFYHYTSQVGKNDPVPSSPPQHWKKLIGTGGPNVTLSMTSTSGGFSSFGSRSSTSNTAGAAPSISSATPRPAAGITPPAGPPVSFADAVAALNNTADIGSEGPTPAAENVPSFDSFGSSLAKMQTLGIFEAV